MADPEGPAQDGQRTGRRERNRSVGEGCFVPILSRPTMPPSHRVFVGRAEIGVGWSKQSNEGRGYLSLKLDDPSFTAPIFANLFEDADDQG